MIFRYCGDLKDEEDQEKERFFDECTIDPTLRDRLSILTRTFHNRKQMVENDPLVFQDDVFEIVPVVSILRNYSSVLLYSIMIRRKLKSGQTRPWKSLSSSVPLLQSFTTKRYSVTSQVEKQDFL